MQCDSVTKIIINNAQFGLANLGKPEPSTVNVLYIERLCRGIILLLKSVSCNKMIIRDLAILRLTLALIDTTNCDKTLESFLREERSTLTSGISSAPQTAKKEHIIIIVKPPRFNEGSISCPTL